MTSAAEPSLGRLRPDLGTLEERIDNCLTEARQFDAEGLQDVIGLLRKARNAVVWKIGE